MTKTILAAVFVAALASPALAQAVIETPNSATVAPPGAPGTVTRQPGSTGAPGATTYSPTGRAADSVATDSAAGGNEGQPSRVGSTGSTGGGDSGH